MKDILDAIKLRPRSCTWEITFRCNFKCLHCASDVNSNKVRGEELSFNDILTVIQDLASLECEQITLSGGEPLMRSDWPEIASAIVSHGMHALLISNGFLIDDDMAHRIKDSGVSLVGLSLDGTESVHNYIRKNCESFSRVRRAAQILNAVNIPVNIITHINQLNLKSIEEIEEIIVPLNINEWRLQLGAPVGRLQTHPELLIEPTDLPAIADFIVAAKARDRIAIAVGDNIGYYSSHEEALRDRPERNGLKFFCGCSAGCLNIGIESNGNVKGCLSLQFDEMIEGNVKEESLVKIWNKKGAFAYTRDFNSTNLHGSCADCEFGEICRGGCTFMAMGATGKPHNNPYCLLKVM